MQKGLLMTVLGFLLTIGGYAQNSISGIVRDASNNTSLPGVNVSVKEKTGAGTITDIDGNFKLKLPEGAKTLIFSFVGYTSQEVPIANKTVFEIRLQSDAKTLDEVVVTALGIKRQSKALGYSVTELRATT